MVGTSLEHVRHEWSTSRGMHTVRAAHGGQCGRESSCTFRSYKYAMKTTKNAANHSSTKSAPRSNSLRTQRCLRSDDPHYPATRGEFQ
jgi:hypothetical protein